MEGTSSAYLSSCQRANVSPIPQFMTALVQNEKSATLQARTPPLNDVDIRCIAEAITQLKDGALLKVLSLEGNSFGLEGVQALMEALEKKPNQIRELRLGRNNLKDTCAAVIGQTLARNPCGLKILDLSENGITRFGVIPIAAALENSQCEIGELSFHNNKIEGDAAEELMEALKHSISLKHLHLGYNTLRDTGARAVARALPQLTQLVTLDLTANRIGPEGGEALASALCEPSCTLRRLNLRHNLLESRGIAAFENVLRINNSLIQLFFGFMSPTPEVGEIILKAVAKNRSLLLLDILGWKLPQQRALEVIQQIQSENNTFAALVTDACQPIIPQLQEENRRRVDRGIHPLYVGSDDREAYVATKSQKRFSRGQSRNSSRARSRSVRSERSGRVSVTRVRKASHGGPDRVDSTTSSRVLTRSRSRPVDDAKESNFSDEKVRKPLSASVTEQKSASFSATASRTDLQLSEEDKELIKLFRELDSVADSNAETNLAVRNIGNFLWEKIKQQRLSTQAVRSRLESLERRQESKYAQSANHDRDYTPKSPQPLFQQHPALGTAGALPSASFHSVLNSQSMNEIANFSSSYPQNHNAVNHAGSSFPGIQKGVWAGKPVPDIPFSSPSPLASFKGPSITRSTSRGRYDLSDPDRGVTPLVRPSEQHDLPPNISARPLEEGGKRCPLETSLQRSASVVNFPPRIEPSPAPDRNPPKRKVTPSALIS